MRDYKHLCKDYENIENFEKAKADNFKNWVCHHRLQTWTSDGKRRDVDILAKELKALNIYYNRPAEELIFLTRNEHAKLHNKGRKFSDEHRKKISDAKKDMSDETKKKISENHKGMLGKRHSEETKRKISEGNKGKQLTEETKKKMSEKAKGRQHTDEAKKKMSEAKKGKPSCRKGSHLTKEQKKKISISNAGRRWYNNGKISKFCYECPEGFIPGRVSWENN